MLFSFATILLTGLLLGSACKKIHLPSLVGMIATGIILGPYVLDFIDPKIISISSELRRIALIIILMRAGLSLNISDLKKVGRTAILMCFVPAAFEMLGYLIAAPIFLDIPYLDAAIMGAVLAAVSPAVIVPRMIKLTEEGYGTKKQIPQMILAGASVDDIFVIIMFSVFTGMAQGNGLDWMQFIKLPVSVMAGIVTGVLCGFILGRFFTRFHMRDSVKVIILLSISFLLDAFEAKFGKAIPFSGLLAIMSMGIGLQINRKIVCSRLSVKFNKLWIFAEIILFVLVGACVDLSYTWQAGANAILVIFLVLIFRLLGVFLCVLKTSLTYKERFFCAISYIPKATVQAAIGGIPLAMGLACGNIILSVAVLGILITAPLGAFLIDSTYKKILEQEKIVDPSEGQLEN